MVINSEDDTFRILKRASFEEANKAWIGAIWYDDAAIALDKLNWTMKEYFAERKALLGY